MGRAVAFFGMLLGERGVLTEVSLSEHVPIMFTPTLLSMPAAEYATPKPDGNLSSSLAGQTLTRGGESGRRDYLSFPCESLA